jgi:hypothetical protein
VTDNEVAYVHTVRDALFDRFEKDHVQDLDVITMRVLAHLKPQCVAAIA